MRNLSIRVLRVLAPGGALSLVLLAFLVNDSRSQVTGTCGACQCATPATPYTGAAFVSAFNQNSDVNIELGDNPLEPGTDAMALQLRHLGAGFQVTNPTVETVWYENIAVGDFDEDGWNDFVAAGTGSNCLVLYKNKTYENFHACQRSDYASTLGLSCSAVTDSQGRGEGVLNCQSGVDQCEDLITTTADSSLCGYSGGTVSNPWYPGTDGCKQLIQWTDVRQAVKPKFSAQMGCAASSWGGTASLNVELGDSVCGSVFADAMKSSMSALDGTHASKKAQCRNGDLPYVAFNQSALESPYTGSASAAGATKYRPFAMVGGDFNLDGHTDVLVLKKTGVAQGGASTASAGSKLNTAKLLYNRLNGTSYCPAPPATCTVAAGTFTARDAFSSVSADVCTSSNSSICMDLAYNISGNFVADMDNDGDLDLIMGSNYGKVLLVAYNNCRTPADPATSTTAGCIASGSGGPGNQPYFGQATALNGLSLDKTQSPWTIASTSGDSTSYCEFGSIAVADMNNDTWPDIAYGCNDKAKLGLLMTGGTTANEFVASSAIYKLVQKQPASIWLADINLDSANDLVVAVNRGGDLTTTNNQNGTMYFLPNRTLDTPTGSSGACSLAATTTRYATTCPNDSNTSYDRFPAQFRTDKADDDMYRDGDGPYTGEAVPGASGNSPVSCTWDSTEGRTATDDDTFNRFNLHFASGNTACAYTSTDGSPSNTDPPTIYDDAGSLGNTTAAAAAIINYDNDPDGTPDYYLFDAKNRDSKFFPNRVQTSFAKCGYVISGPLSSTLNADSNISKVKFKVYRDKPAGTTITYWASNRGATTKTDSSWRPADNVTGNGITTCYHLDDPTAVIHDYDTTVTASGSDASEYITCEYEFDTTGSDLRFMAELCSDSPNRIYTPQLNRITMSYDYTPGYTKLQAGVSTSAEVGTACTGVKYFGAVTNQSYDGKLYALSQDSTSSGTILFTGNEDASEILNDTADTSRKIYAVANGSVTGGPDNVLGYNPRNWPRVEVSSSYVSHFATIWNETSTNADTIISWYRGARFGALGVSDTKDEKLGGIENSTPAILVPPSEPSWYNFNTVTAAEKVGAASVGNCTASSTTPFQPDTSAPLMTFTTYSNDGIDCFKSRNASRPELVLVGSRDGMLHAFAGAANVTGGSGGQERWAFVPRSVVSYLPNDRATNICTSATGCGNGTELAFIDGSPTLGDVKMPWPPSVIVGSGSEGAANWRTVAIVGQGGGGNRVFALDVTDTVNADGTIKEGPIPLWEFTDEELGNTRSKPAILRLGSSDYVTVFASGLGNSAAAGDTVFMIDIDSGQERARWSIDESGTYISTAIVAVDTADADGVRDIDAVVDYLFFGDSKGRLWRLKVGTNSLTADGVEGLGALHSPALASNPIFSTLKSADAGDCTQRSLTSTTGKCETPIVGGLAARQNSAKQLIVYFATGGLDSVDGTATGNYQWVYALQAGRSNANNSSLGRLDQGAALGKFPFLYKGERSFSGPVALESQLVVATARAYGGDSTACDVGSGAIYVLTLPANGSGFTTTDGLATSTGGAVYRVTDAQVEISGTTTTKALAQIKGAITVGRAQVLATTLLGQQVTVGTIQECTSGGSGSGAGGGGSGGESGGGSGSGGSSGSSGSGGSGGSSGSSGSGETRQLLDPPTTRFIIEL